MSPSPSLAPPQGCVAECPACPHRSWSAADSLAQKEGFVRQRLESWADRVEPIRSAPPERRWGYREKVRLHAEWRDGWLLGLMHREEIVPIPECPLHAPGVNAAAQALAAALPPPHVFPLAFYVQSGTHAILVVKQAALPDLAWLDATVTDQLQTAGITALWVHTHPAAGRRVLTAKGWHRAWGNAEATDQNGLAHGPSSFQQALAELHADSLGSAARYLNANRDHHVVDLCSGVGASLRQWAADGSAALGVELHGESARYARQNAAGVEVLQGRCADRLPQVRGWCSKRATTSLVYANPPRLGLELEVVRWIATECRPARMAYLSCSPATLARDLAALSGSGFVVERVIPFDFLPQTIHVEVLALVAGPG